MKKLFFTFVFVLIAAQIFAQLTAKYVLEQRGEVYFKFKIEKSELNELSKIVSIDNYKNGCCYAYANKTEFDNFLKFGIEYELVEKYYEAKEELLLAENVEEMFTWERYPSYAIYEKMMQYFASTYSEICHLDTIGTTYSGYNLLVLKISDNVADDEAEPEFFLGGQIHGDELIGSMVCLNIIDKILRDYSTNEQIANIVNNMQLYVNPISNPEGTYLVGGDSIKYAIRYSRDGVGLEHFIDLNRNFPDFIAGGHPDEKPYAAETQAFIELANNRRFTMSANIHSGAEVINYPFDTEEQLPADNDWWKYVSAEYVNNVRNASENTYFDGAGFDNGYTNGYAWYSISGSRQDYMNYFHNCREVTLELSNDKIIPNSQLRDIIMYNQKAMLDYITQATYGIHGFVSDSITGQPLKAKIIIHNYDYLNSHVYSFLPYGDFYRYLKEGTYNISFYAEGYVHKTITINVEDKQQTILNVSLKPGEDTENIDTYSDDNELLYPNPAVNYIFINSDKLYNTAKIFDSTGKCVMIKDKTFGMIDVSSLQPGVFFLRLQDNNGVESYKFVKL